MLLNISSYIASDSLSKGIICKMNSNLSLFTYSSQSNGGNAYDNRNSSL